MGYYGVNMAHRKQTGPKLKDSEKPAAPAMPVPPACSHTTLVKTQNGIYMCAECRGVLKYNTQVFVVPPEILQQQAEAAKSTKPQ